MSTRNIAPAQRRLLIALCLSALLHAWLMESHYGKGASRGSAGVMPLAVRVLPFVVEETRMPLPDQAAGVAVNRVPEAMAAASARSAGDNATVLSQPSDPTYYAAGDLDVFPSALTKPDLGAALGGNHGSGAGKVRATVLIDETGAVNAVRGVEAPAGDVETAARELLLRTRFTPARNKDGRIVKAQVLVALDYDTRASR